MFGTCETCPTSRERFAERLCSQPVRLAGSYAAQMCSRCQNEWHVYLIDTAKWKKRCAAERRLREIDVLALQLPRNEIQAHNLASEVASILEGQEQNNRAITKLAEEWVTERRKAVALTEASEEGEK